MHIVIDILAGITLLLFLLSGWHKGFLLSLLGIVRVIVAYGLAYLGGRYLGFWLGEIIHRPRIVTIPMVAGLTFVIVTFIFHVIMTNMRHQHHEKMEKEDFFHPWYSSLSGSAINVAIGTFSLIFLFWLGNLFMVGVSGISIPGSRQSRFSQFSQRTVYETTYRAISRKGCESQAAAMAHVISNPSEGLQHLEKVLKADSIQQLFSDQQFAQNILSGDPNRIEQDASLQQLFNDRATLEELKKLGILSGTEQKSTLCEKLSYFGSNENIRISIQNLKAKQLLSTDKILDLIRDPDFDVIITELMK